MTAYLPPQLVAQKVLKQITGHPETFDMDSWGSRQETESECRTTCCIAGWAGLFTHQLEFNKHGVLSITSPKYMPGDFVAVGADALGMDYNEADLLFHLSNDAALKCLEYLADGEEIDWTAIREEFYPGDGGRWMEYFMKYRRL